MKTNQPSKEQTRIWLKLRTLSRRPPPSPAEICGQLGWKLLPNNGKPA